MSSILLLIFSVDFGYALYEQKKDSLPFTMEDIKNEIRKVF